jgi:hypothetical protein
MNQGKRWVSIDIHLDKNPLLGINGTHCVKCFHHMGKILLNLTPGEPLALVKKLSCFDNLIELYVLLAGFLHLGFHDLI